MQKISKRFVASIEQARLDGLITDEEVRTRELLNNHGRGRCGFVIVVWKLNMQEGGKELYAIASTEEVAKGIREQHYKEAHDYGIEPKYYITWEERMVLWSRDVFKDRYRIWDLDNQVPVYRDDRNKDIYYEQYTSARKYGEKLQKLKTLKDWCIQKYNRQRRRWDVVHHGITGSRNRI